jgi:hypothetical protein
MEFYANFQGIPKIIPNNSKESQRIPKIDRSVIPTIISPSRGGLKIILLDCKKNVKKCKKL